MCTAISYTPQAHYFGRNLDLEHVYKEEIVITPRRFPLSFRCGRTLPQHKAMIGVAYVADGYPLYYDAINESGLGIAGLNFVGNAAFHTPRSGCDNIAVFEFIPWILGQCASVEEARALLARINLTREAFSAELQPSQLHWLIADRRESITVESMEDGLHVYDNPVGVLSNNPPFPMQMTFLANYLNLTRDVPENRFAPAVPIDRYSRGMGAIGLPGDLSSASRFVRAAFTKCNSVAEGTEESCVSQFFHILGSVEQQRGCAHLGEGAYEITQYSACCNTERGIYYYKTYDNSCIHAVSMHAEDLDSERLAVYPMITAQKIIAQNVPQRL